MKNDEYDALGEKYTGHESHLEHVTLHTNMKWSKKPIFIINIKWHYTQHTDPAGLHGT